LRSNLGYFAGLEAFPEVEKIQGDYEDVKIIAQSAHKNT
jgi:hypothetical protein